LGVVLRVAASDVTVRAQPREVVRGTMASFGDVLQKFTFILKDQDSNKTEKLKGAPKTHADFKTSYLPSDELCNVRNDVPKFAEGVWPSRS
jgi:hypothetical protein